jgi:hypothetical protein
MSQPNIANLVAMAALCVASTAVAFEVSGMHSGMSRKDASALLVKSGARLFPTQADPDLLVASRDETIFSLKFCRNRLAQYSYTLSGGKATYIRELEVLTRRRGPGHAENVSVDRGARIDSEGMSWTSGPEYLKLSHVAGSSAHEESVSITYIDNAICK